MSAPSGQQTREGALVPCPASTADSQGGHLGSRPSAPHCRPQLPQRQRLLASACAARTRARGPRLSCRQGELPAGLNPAVQLRGPPRSRDCQRTWLRLSLPAAHGQRVLLWRRRCPRPLLPPSGGGLPCGEPPYRLKDPEPDPRPLHCHPWRYPCPHRRRPRGGAIHRHRPRGAPMQPPRQRSPRQGGQQVHVAPHTRPRRSVCPSCAPRGPAHPALPCIAQTFPRPLQPASSNDSCDRCVYRCHVGQKRLHGDLGPAAAIATLDLDGCGHRDGCFFCCYCSVCARGYDSACGANTPHLNLGPLVVAPCRLSRAEACPRPRHSYPRGRAARLSLRRPCARLGVGCARRPCACGRSGSCCGYPSSGPQVKVSDGAARAAGQHRGWCARHRRPHVCGRGDPTCGDRAWTFCLIRVSPRGGHALPAGQRGRRAHFVTLAARAIPRRWHSSQVRPGENQQFVVRQPPQQPPIWPASVAAISPAAPGWREDIAALLPRVSASPQWGPRAINGIPRCARWRLCEEILSQRLAKVECSPRGLRRNHLLR